MNSSIIIPHHTMDNVPVSGIAELHAHLHQLSEDPSLPFQVKLLDDVELQLTEDNIPPLLPTLLPSVAEILKTTTQDPTPLLSLTTKLLSPLSFTQTLAVADPPSLLTALSSPVPGANLLALAVIQKAADSPSDASILSALPRVVDALVTCWLASEDVGVGERAARVLGDALQTDCEALSGGADESGSETDPSPNGNQVARRPATGHGRLWQLILLSRPALSLIHEHCSSTTTTGQAPRRTPREVTISQGRLLRLLPRLCAMNLAALSRSVCPDLFILPAATQADVGQGLLQWAALGMVEKADILMHLNLVDFFETLVSVMRVSEQSSAHDALVKKLVKAAVQSDDGLKTALKTLPDRTVEEEADALQRYITSLLT